VDELSTFEVRLGAKRLSVGRHMVDVVELRRLRDFLQKSRKLKTFS
jgi:hypothetical protein